MTIPGGWIVAGLMLVLALGLVLMFAGRGIRRRRGLGGGKTVSLDRVTLTSRRLGLTGRPDRLIRTGRVIVIEEWKSAHQVRLWHRAQMGVYFILAEERFGVRPSHGFIVCGDGSRHRIDNSDELRAWVLEMAEEIRRSRASVDQLIIVHPKPGQCRPCGMLGHCGQAKL
jgi:CRISPR-associated exonuclease Cas4